MRVGKKCDYRLLSRTFIKFYQRKYFHHETSEKKVPLLYNVVHSRTNSFRKRSNFSQSIEATQKLAQSTTIHSISSEEYACRRFQLMEKLCEHTKSNNHIVIMPGTPRRYMIDKIPYLFRQDSDMLYLSGCREPDCVLVLHSLPDSVGPDHKSIMFTPPFDPSSDLWNGPRTDDSQSPTKWGVDIGFPSTEIIGYLSSIKECFGSVNVWYNFPSHPVCHEDAIKNWLLTPNRIPALSPKKFVHALRVIKSPAEIELMRETCRISAEAICATMKTCQSPCLEHNLFATVDYQCRINGADHLAYPPVVAGGNRANIIHYINNNSIVNNGELVLMDAGSEYKGYSGDVTRTWPVNGEFSPPQRDLYEAVLDVQKSVITKCAERPSLDELFVFMCSKLGPVLQEVGLLPRNLLDNQLTRAAFGFCPHHVSHYLGMDVHDTASISKRDKIPVGSVITVEPGIYVNEKNTSVPSRYLGIGIRIEDDILITETGVEVLSEHCPKHPDEIEALVGAGL